MSIFDFITRFFRPGSESEHYPRPVKRLISRGDFRGAGTRLQALGRDADALSVFEQGEAHDLAAECAEKLGHIERAAELHEKAGQLRQAAQLFFQWGNHLRAVELYGQVGDFVMAARALEGAPQKFEPESAQVWENAVIDMVPNEGERISTTELAALRGYSLRAAEAYAMAGNSAKAAHFYEIIGWQTLADQMREELPPGAMDQLDAARQRIRDRLHESQPGEWETLPSDRAADLLAPIPVVTTLDDAFDVTDLGQTITESDESPTEDLDEQPEMDPELLELLSCDWPAVRVIGSRGGESPAEEPSTSEEDIPSEEVPSEEAPRTRYLVVERLHRPCVGTAARGVDASTGAEFLMVSLPEEAVAGKRRKRAFETVSRSVRSLRHDSIVPVLGHGIVGGRPYWVTGYTPGPTLEELLDGVQGRRLPLVDALAIARNVLEGLAFAHENGIAHGAVGPASIICPNPPGAVLANFGLAELVDRETLSPIAPFLSPEQVAGAKPDARSDLFGVGCIFDRLLARTSLSGFGEQPKTAPFGRANSTVRRTLFALAQSCLAPDPAARPTSTAPLLDGVFSLQMEMARAGAESLETEVVASSKG